ncbi:Proteasome subunit alpha type-3 [Spraguea lophii 42_110]|uniref:Proteasome subunit alpha type-3 n=1 Tax=Spraguea lophii (strain 42_110) TaxID=1358809 RepID=S7XK43_SPRLO|nr:Proteasome subunit alpha type-3 [Spraguea lophii 42_110]
MTLIDFGPYYSSTGNIMQLDYAQKAADTGMNALGMCNTNGIVIAVQKKVDPLEIMSSNHHIKNIGDKIFLTYSGEDSDFILFHNLMKNEIMNDLDYRNSTTVGKYKELTKYFFSTFSSHNACRPLGCNILAGIKQNDTYHLISTNPSSLTLHYKSHVIGKSSSTAKTELEKINIEALSIDQMVENIIRVIYKSHDPLVDTDEFTIEVAILSKETDNKFKRLEYEEIEGYIEMYKDMIYEETS